jgi:putative NADPH-quinone reductase
MRVLVVYAHPSQASFNASLHAQVLEALRLRGHAIDDCDLYGEGFDPVLSRHERLVYDDPEANRAGVAGCVDRLLAADALVLVYPVWNEGFPAILKGFLDRVFLPGVSFVKEGGAPKPGLQNIARIATVCTYGAGRLPTMILGDPPRKVVKRLLRAMTGRRARCEYLALYGMDGATPQKRARFRRRVAAAFARW